MSARRVVIIGSGNIGTDLCERLLGDQEFEIVALVGRRPDSPGLVRMSNKGVPVEFDGLSSLKSLIESCDGIFDATSAPDHIRLWREVKESNRWVIDLTPSRVGTPIVPVLIERLASMDLARIQRSNYSMVSCGGQSSAPLLYALSRCAEGIQEVEVSSSIASLSAGPATRRNIDDYIDATENLAKTVTGCENAKAILVLNPADPPVMMRTSVHIRAAGFDHRRMHSLCAEMVKDVKKYVPGYDLVVEPHETRDLTVSATVCVTGSGFFLPSYAGNLDIINAAAVETARRI